MSAAPFDVLVLASIDWTASWQRHQAFAAQWARAGRRVFFVENTGLRGLSLRDIGRVIRRLGRAASPSRRPDVPKDVFVVSPFVLPPTSPLFRFLNRSFFVPRLLGRLERLGLREGPAVFCYPPSATSLAVLDGLKPSLVVYDCVDNFFGLPKRPADLRETEAALLSRADLVVTTSRTLYEEKRLRHGNVLELHHGVGPAFFIPPPPPRPPKRLVYFGTIWRALDYAPVRALAEAGFEVELIGPVKEATPRLPPGVRLAGPVAHEELPARLAAADALLLPYADDEYNRGVIPAKIYECLATGRPVLASPLPALKAVPELAAALSFAGAPEEWVAAARALGQDDARARESRVALAREHAQEKSFARLRDAVEKALDAR